MQTSMVRCKLSGAGAEAPNNTSCAHDDVLNSGAGSGFIIHGRPRCLVRQGFAPRMAFTCPTRVRWVASLTLVVPLSNDHSYTSTYSVTHQNLNCKRTLGMGDRIRTCDSRIRNPILCPLSYAHISFYPFIALSAAPGPLSRS